jgi:hypothetical protein
MRFGKGQGGGGSGSGVVIDPAQALWVWWDQGGDQWPEKPEPEPEIPPQIPPQDPPWVPPWVPPEVPPQIPPQVPPEPTDPPVIPVPFPQPVPRTRARCGYPQDPLTRVVLSHPGNRATIAALQRMGALHCDQILRPVVVQSMPLGATRRRR